MEEQRGEGIHTFVETAQSSATGAQLFASVLLLKWCSGVEP